LQDNSKQFELAKKVVDEKLPVRKLEKLVQEVNEPKDSIDMTPAASAKVELTSKLVSGLSEEIQKLLGTKTSIDYNQGKGKISIHFYSDDELNSIVEKLREGCQS